MAIGCYFLAVGSAMAFDGGLAHVQVTKLDNGLRVMCLEDHSVALAEVEVWVRAGILNEDESKNGISHFLEHLVFKGTTRRGPGEMDREIESLGATLDAATSKDWARFSTTLPSKYLDKAMDVLSDAVMNARLDEDDLELERAVVWDEIASRESSPITAGLAILDATVFKTHPYRLPLEGTRESLSKISREDVYDYYKRFYVPANATLIVVGDVSNERVVQAAKKYLGDWKGASFPIGQVPVEPPQLEARRVYRQRDTKNAYLIIGYHAPGVSSGGEVYATDVLLTHMGIGYRSWMSVELKDKLKLAQETSADYLTHRDAGMMALYLVVPPDKVQETEKLILAKTKELAETPLSESELRSAKRSLLGTYAFECETFEGRARALGFYDSIGDYTIAVQYADRINAVTADEVQAVAAKYLKPETRSVVVISPREPPK